MRIQRLTHQQYSVPLTRCQHFCHLITFLEIFFLIKSLSTVPLSPSSPVTVSPGSSATWFRPGLQYTRTRGTRKVVGFQRDKSSFLLCPRLFLWARTEGCHGDEVGPSPTAWSGKSSSLLWHLLRLEETHEIETNSLTHIHTQECVWKEGETC